MSCISRTMALHWVITAEVGNVSSLTVDIFIIAVISPRQMSLNVVVIVMRKVRESTNVYGRPDVRPSTVPTLPIWLGSQYLFIRCLPHPYLYHVTVVLLLPSNLWAKPHLGGGFHLGKGTLLCASPQAGVHTILIYLNCPFVLFLVT